MKKAFLFMLSLLAVVGIQAQTSPYTGSEVGAGNFYIYNVESGYWLQNNNRVGDWNSQVQVDVQGFDWELIALEGGTWQLNPKFANNHSLNSDADNGYLDTGRPVSAWTLTPVDGVSNGYTISSNSTTLGVNADKLLVKDGSAGTVWQLVTAAERLQIFKDQAANITADNPVDLTWMIPGANMNIADERAGELIKVNPDNAGAKYVVDQTNNLGNGIREVWSNNGSYDIGYALQGMPAGVYRLIFSGFYRDGSVGGVGAKHAEGTEVIRSEIYFNEKTQPVMSICQRTSSGNGCNTQTGNYYVPNNRGEAAQATSRGYYVNPAVKIVLSEEGSLDFGVRSSEGVGDDWLILDYFKLVYYGPEDLSQSLAVLQSAIEQAEAFDASATSTAMATALSTAIAEAKDKLESTDGDVIEAAAEDLLAVLKKAQALDLTVLKETIALAQQEGIDVSAAEDILDNGMDDGAAFAALEALRTARKIKALGGAPDIYTGEVPAAGEFYFYNLGTGMWLNQGSDWCTHAAVDQAGLLVTFEESGDGFIFRTPWGTFNNSPYTDTPVNTVYRFQAVEGKDGVYNILEGSDLMGYNPDGKTDGKKYWNSVSNVAGADPADPNYQWKIVSMAQRKELLVNATKDAPVDATFLINNPSLQRQPGYDMWLKEVDGGNGGARVSSQDDNNGDRAADYAWEYYDTNSFKFYQELEGLQPGIYEISATAFYRDGNGGFQAGVYNDGGELLQLAYLFANGEQAPLPNIASVIDKVPGVATQGTKDGNFVNWPREAVEYFETGFYKTTVRVIVEDGKLSFGIAKDSKSNGGDWVVLDNFRLTYLGYDEAAALQARYESALASIEDGSAYSIKTDVSGTPYYLKTDGSLTDDATAAGIFKFSKVKGDAYEYGFNLLESYFTNPPSGGNPTLNNGHIAVDPSSKRANWEAQVFFKNAEGKYAVRATNAGGSDSGWGLNAKTFWTVNDGPVAEYSFDTNYIWELEYQYGAEGVAAHEAAAATIASWIPAVQAGGGLVQDASQYTSNAVEQSEGSIAALLDDTYETYFHSCWSNGPAEDHYLQAELTEPVQKFQFYFKKRHNNNNNRPTTIVISASTDGSTFTDVTTINSGMPTDASVLDYLSDVIDLGGEYKYVRFTVTATNNGATNNNHVFFTFSEFYILPSIPAVESALAMVKEGTPTYSLDVAAVEAADAALKDALNVVKVTYVLKGEDGSTIEEKVVLQERGSEVNVPSTMTNIGYCDYAIEGTIGQEDCTITITRSLKAGLVTALTDLSNDKAYTITCDRGAMLTKDGYMASTAHSSLTAAEASNFAIINYEDNYYLYSAAESKFVTNTGALADEPTNGVEDAIKMTPQTMPYFLYYFVKGGTNNGLNTNGNDPYGYVINTWMNADAGNKYYMIEAADFDATAALAALDNFFHPAVVLNAPTWSVEAGTQAEPTWIPVGETLKINFTADNLEANGLTEDDVKVKVTVLVSGDVDNTMTMGSFVAKLLRFLLVRPTSLLH